MVWKKWNNWFWGLSLLYGNEKMWHNNVDAFENVAIDSE
jgi:hypothetical protein